jgi:ATP-dependent RNA circularization protein (DNA/RNA ligase family)
LDFFRFPHTPHLAWLGNGSPRDDKVLAPPQVAALLAGPVRVEEKLDGANLGLSWGPDGVLRAQNRGQYLARPYGGQFSRLGNWLGIREWRWRERIPPHLILFGEWCAATHSLNYLALPDWFLLFDVYDRDARRFWSAQRRNALATSLDLSPVPALQEGRTDLGRLIALVNSAHSRFRDGPLEGLVIRRDSADWSESRAKLVRAGFAQVIGDHWRSRTIEWNRVRGERVP